MQELKRIVAEPNASEKLFTLLEQQVQNLVGPKLVTLMWLDYAQMRARRIYTNRPDLYRSGDSKPMVDNPWHQHVVVGQKTYVANSLDEMDDQFADKDFFSAHGCASVVNLPIIFNGKTVGALNLLHDENYFTPEKIAKTQDLVLTATICILVAKAQNLDA